MQNAAQIRNFINEFIQDTKGAFGILTALLFILIMLCAGVALDFTRIAHTKSRIAGAVDAALLVTGNNLGRGITDISVLEDEFNAFLSTNLMTSSGNVLPHEVKEFHANPDTGEVRALVGSKLNATLMRMAGHEIFDVNVEAGAIFEKKEVEIAMMLDVTGSMKQGGKIKDLRSAAKDAINILLPDANTKGTRIGLVPYSWSVNAGKYAKLVTKGNQNQTVASLNSGFSNGNSNVNTNRCVTERGGHEAATDTFYKDAPLGSDVRAIQYNLCPKLEIRPLTSSKNKLLNDVGKLPAQGYTAGHLGIAWSYYMLSDKWQKLWPSSSDPAPYSNKVSKVAILMTDGEFNTFYHGTQGNAFGPHANKSNQLARDLCDDMKAVKNGNPGIIIYSIAFQAPVSAQKTLKACANTDTDSVQYYYQADDGAELKQAFRSIATSIQSLRLSK